MQKIPFLSGILSGVFLSGCGVNTETQITSYPGLENVQNGSLKATRPEPQNRIVPKDIYHPQNYAAPATEVIRNGRYTLVSITPDDGQKYLLEQVVTVRVPKAQKNVWNATVEQGLRSTLKNTGLGLCYASAFNTDRNVATLFSRPLPKVHYTFGPVKLYEALQMIAGPAYELTLNDITRTVCFKTRVPPAEQQAKPTEIITSTTTTEIIEEE